MSVITLSSDISRTPRVMQIEGMFDISAQEKTLTKISQNIPDLNSQNWNIGLIVGPSGSGKSTVAKHLFPEELKSVESMKWSKKSAIVDEFPKDMKVRDVIELLSSVGFSSPPAWLRSFDTLSNGEQFRVTMARILAENKNLVVIDEFTSVVDRTVAKIGSHAIAKTVRKLDQKLVAISCHYDVQDWLQPDWIYEPHSGQFSWRSVQPRPRVELEIVKGTHEAWRTFSRHHYLNESLHKGADIYVGFIEDQPAVICALLHLVHNRVKNGKRVSRIVTLPDFQGIGVAGYLLDAVGGALKIKEKQLYITTSHPAMMKSLNRRTTWAVTRSPSRVAQQSAKGNPNLQASRARITAGFKYIGSEDDRLLDLIPTKVR